MKKMCLLIAAIAIAHVVMAQDVIVTKQSERIDAKILKVTESEIEYKRQNNPDGPTFTLPTSKILTIMYQSGEVQTFDVKDKSKSSSSSSNTIHRTFKSIISLGFSMPTAKGNDYSYYYGYTDVKTNMYGGYIGYAARIPVNDFFTFRPGMLMNFAGYSGGHMLDIRMPLLAEIGVTFDNDMGVYVCVGPQMLFGLSLGGDFFDYPDYGKRFDLGISVGGGFDFTSHMGVEAQYTFGLLDRGLEDFKKVNFLSVGFNFYL